MVSSYALGLTSHLAPGAAIVVNAFVAAAALLFCRTQAVVPPGPIFMVMAAALAASSPVHASTAVQNIRYILIDTLWACVVAFPLRPHTLQPRDSAPHHPPL